MELLEAYSGKENYIFVSYSHKDSKVVLPVIEKLMSAGFRVWYDEGIDPGSEWDDNIASHIEDCAYFIAFISGNYIESSNCRDELHFARDLEKDRLMVYTEEVKLPPGIKMRISRLQSIFMYTYKSKDAFYEKLFDAQNIDSCKESVPAAVEPTISIEAAAPAANTNGKIEPDTSIHREIKVKLDKKAVFTMLDGGSGGSRADYDMLSSVFVTTLGLMGGMAKKAGAVKDGNDTNKIEVSLEKEKEMAETLSRRGRKFEVVRYAYGVWVNTAGVDRLNTMKIMRKYTSISLADAKHVVERVPCAINESLALETAEKLVTELAAAGVVAYIFE